MDQNTNSTRILFTAKADLALEDILKKFNLEETPEEFMTRAKEGKPSKTVIVDRLTKDLVKGTLSEKDFANSLQKELEVSIQIAEQISKEITARVVPFVEKVPEEKLEDPIFIEELSKRVLGTTNENSPAGPEKSKLKINNKEDLDIFPRFESTLDEIKNQSTPVNRFRSEIQNVTDTRKNSNSPIPPKRQEKSKKLIQNEEIKINTPQIKQPSGPDNYREPIG